MTHNNIISEFKATGSFPLDSRAIRETAYAPSIRTEIPTLLVSEDIKLERLQLRVTPKPSVSKAVDIS